jgi:hypothetical protein
MSGKFDSDPGFPAGDLPQILQVPYVVDFCEEARTTVVAALDDVLGDVGQVEARTSWHGAAALKRATPL